MRLNTHSLFSTAAQGHPRAVEYGVSSENANII